MYVVGMMSMQILHVICSCTAFYHLYNFHFFPLALKTDLYCQLSSQLQYYSVGRAGHKKKYLTHLANAVLLHSF